jgi:hypothetical protein
MPTSGTDASEEGTTEASHPDGSSGSTPGDSSAPGSAEDSEVTEPLEVPFGSQALVLIPSLQSPLELLPAEAFDNLLVVSTTRSPKQVEQLVREAGGDPNTVGVVPVSGSSTDYDGPCWTTSAVHPNDLTGIYDRFERGLEHVKPGEGWVVVDNVNVLLMYAQRTSVLNFLDSIATGARRRNAAGVFAMVRDAVTDETHGRVRESVDLELDRTDLDV